MKRCVDCTIAGHPSLYKLLSSLASELHEPPDEFVTESRLPVAELVGVDVPIVPATPRDRD